ncbi:hypothetical protein HK405_003482, partial [Cladochytrium tenue]
MVRRKRDEVRSVVSPPSAAASSTLLSGSGQTPSASNAAIAQSPARLAAAAAAANRPPPPSLSSRSSLAGSLAAQLANQTPRRSGVSRLKPPPPTGINAPTPRRSLPSLKKAGGPTLGAPRAGMRPRSAATGVNAGHGLDSHGSLYASSGSSFSSQSSLEASQQSLARDGHTNGAGSAFSSSDTIAYASAVLSSSLSGHSMSLLPAKARPGSGAAQARKLASTSVHPPPSPVEPNHRTAAKVDHSVARDDDSYRQAHVRPQQNIVDRESHEGRANGVTAPNAYQQMPLRGRDSAASSRPTSASVNKALKLLVFNSLCPAHDDLEPEHQTEVKGQAEVLAERASLFHFQAYEIDHELDIPLLRLAANRVCSEYKVLCTRFWRNERIVDGDVLGIFDRGPWASFSPDRFVREASLDRTPSGNLAAIARDWLVHLDGLDHPFQLIVPARQRTPSTSQVLFIGSSSIVDEAACSFIAKEIFSVYSQCVDSRRLPGSQSPDRILSGYTCKEEGDDFIDFAYASKPSRDPHIFWKRVCIETVQDSVEGRERDDIESQLRRLTIDIGTLRMQVASLTKKRGEIEHELNEMKRQRLQIDLDSTGPVEAYIDPVTNEVIEVSKAAKAAIIRVVLGEEAIEDDVTALLFKHDIPVEVQSRLGKPQLTLEGFSALTDDHLMILGILTKDRRKVLALSEYVRNRVKESLQEQTKVKFALERKILKAQRELDSACTQLKTAKNSLEANDDTCIRLQGILKPPTTETFISPLTLDELASIPRPLTRADAAAQIDAELADPEEAWGCLAFEVDAAIVSNLRDFRDNCRAAAKQRRQARLRRGITDDHAFDLDGEEDSDADEGKPDAGWSQETSGSSVESVCLAAFAVTLRHIAGQERFLVGYGADLRGPAATSRTAGTDHAAAAAAGDPLVGPLSDIVPVRVDLSGKRATFNDLVAAVAHGARVARRRASDAPYAAVAARHALPQRLPVQFRFFRAERARAWRAAGLEPRDLLALPNADVRLPSAAARASSVRSAGGESGGGGLLLRRLWSLPGEPAADGGAGTTADLRLVLAEINPVGGGGGGGSDGAVVAGALHFRRARFAEDQAAKWVAKFLTTLEGVEPGGGAGTGGAFVRDLFVSSMISR